MKTRHGFVSNSSSSSFAVPRTAVSDKQLHKIKNYRHFGKKLGIPFAESPVSGFDDWEITESKHSVKGSTQMNNFDMRDFLEKIGIDPQEISITGH
jgi:hypothetical protein